MKGRDIGFDKHRFLKLRPVNVSREGWEGGGFGSEGRFWVQN